MTTPKNAPPLKVWIWDSISQEVGEAYPSISPDAPPGEILRAAYKFIDFTPSPKEKWTSVDLPGMRLITGQDEFGHDYVMCWGRRAEEFAKFIDIIDLTEPIEGTDEDPICPRCGARFAEDPSCGKSIHDTLPSKPVDVTDPRD